MLTPMTVTLAGVRWTGDIAALAEFQDQDVKFSVLDDGRLDIGGYSSPVKLGDWLFVAANGRDIYRMAHQDVLDNMIIDQDFPRDFTPDK